MSLGKKLKQLRKEYKYSQAVVARDIEVSQQAYSFYENDKKKPTMPVIARLARLYQIPMSELLNAEENTKEQQMEKFIEVLTRRIWAIIDLKYINNNFFDLCLVIEEQARISLMSVQSREILEQKEFDLDYTTLGKLREDYLEPFKEGIENKNQDTELISGLVETIFLKEKEIASKYFE